MCTIKGSAKIINNKAHVTGTPNSFIGTGGGIQLDGGILTLEDGTVISGNSAQDGGGVYVQDGEFAMKGGKIENNTAQNGGGVYIDAQASGVGTFKMEGSATVTPSAGNEAGKNDVYLNNEGSNRTRIIVTGELTSTSAARLTVKYIESGAGSGYFDGRVVIEGDNNSEPRYKLTEDDVSKFEVTPEPPTWIHATTTYWKLKYDGSNVGTGALKRP